MRRGRQGRVGVGTAGMGARGVTRLSLRRPAAASGGGTRLPASPCLCPGPCPQPSSRCPRPGAAAGGAGAALHGRADRLLLHRGAQQPRGEGGGRKGERGRALLSLPRGALLCEGLLHSSE